MVCFRLVMETTIDFKMYLEWNGRGFNDPIINEAGKHRMQVQAFMEECEWWVKQIFFYSKTKKKFIPLDSLGISDKIYFRIDEVVQAYIK